MGRPSLYTVELGDQICERIASGESLRAICSEEEFPDKATVFRWLAKDQIFRDQYARSKEIQAEYFAEELMEIADDGTNDFVERADKKGNVKVVVDQENIQRSKLRVDTRKWIASKLLAKKYGDKLDLNMAGGLNITNLTDEELAAKLAAHGVAVDSPTTA